VVSTTISKACGTIGDGDGVGDGGIALADGVGAGIDGVTLMVGVTDGAGGVGDGAIGTNLSNSQRGFSSVPTFTKNLNNLSDIDKKRQCYVFNFFYLIYR
jgi:hypothetical protein